MKQEFKIAKLQKKYVDWKKYEFFEILQFCEWNKNIKFILVINVKCKKMTNKKNSKTFFKRR